MDKLTVKEQIALFNESWKAIDKSYERYAKSVGLSYMSLVVLEVIYYKQESCTQKFICKEAYLPKQTVNVIIKAFWEQGYVELKEILSDRRNKRIHLTAAGLDYAEKIIGRLEKAEEAALGQFTQEQRTAVIGLIKSYETAFKESLQAD